MHIVILEKAGQTKSVIHPMPVFECFLFPVECGDSVSFPATNETIYEYIT